jgi:ATP-dependent RNA circularization protein (DNA/RNA ligase family)
MIQYHKIESVFKRDPETNFATFLDEFTNPTFEALAHIGWVGTEKVDGTNIRISAHEIGGRTDNAVLPKTLVPVLEAIQDRFEDPDVSPPMKDRHNPLILFGEGYGAGIQKGGGAYRPDKAFVLFDVYNTENGRWWSREWVENLAQAWDIPIVPVLGETTLTGWVNWVNTTSNRESKLHPGAPNEGVVLRPTVELKDDLGKRVITKLKFRDFPSDRKV